FRGVPGAELQGRPVVVTGGASGIGLATASRLAAGGARVVIADLDLDQASDAARALDAIAVRADGAQAADTDAMARAAVEAFGRLDAIVCNAGLATFPKPALEIPEDEFERIFAVNVKGAWLSVRSAIPALRAAGGGSVVITGSIMGERAR